jgi:hypothetical protein
VIGPVVIGGAPRSGTTLVLSILSSDPALAAIPFETWCLCADGGVERDRLRVLIGPLWNQRWVEKTPYNVRHIGAILDEFPTASFIHVVRDGRDVTTSHFPGHRHYMMPPDGWADDVAAGLAYRDHPRVFTLYYEELVGDFPESLRPLCEFLELDSFDLMAEYPEHATVQMAHQWAHPARAVHQDSVGRWRDSLHADALARFMESERASEVLSSIEVRSLHG